MKVIITCIILAALLSPCLATEDTADAASNMTYTLMNTTGVHSAYVQIKPDVALFETEADWFSPTKSPSETIRKIVAGLYGNYLKQHPDYNGNLAFNMYTIEDGLVMSENVTNEDARANYAFIDYKMIKNLRIIKIPTFYDPRSGF